MKPKGLSILIPVYNHDASSLIKTLHQQASDLDIVFEIRCYDDYSHPEIKKRNRSVQKTNRVVYEELPYNLGRSKIRNKLAQEAEYPNILFIDGDSKITDDQFLKQYIITSFSHEVIIGGTSYSSTLQDPRYALRWKYGIEREQLSADERNKKPYLNFTLNNLFISKDIYSKIGLDEDITTYGHEDTKFGFMLKNDGIVVRHINNPVEHIGLETSEEFLSKTKESVKNLYKLSKQNFGLESKLYHSSLLFRNRSMNRLFTSFYNLFKNHIERNLASSDPRLFYFDMFKLNLMLQEISA